MKSTEFIDKRISQGDDREHAERRYMVVAGKARQEHRYSDTTDSLSDDEKALYETLRAEVLARRKEAKRSAAFQRQYIGR